MPSCAITTLYTPEIEEMGRFTAYNKSTYAYRHVYGFMCSDKTLDPTRPPAWSKLLLVLQAMERFDWVFWSDADAVITAMDRKLDEFMDAAADMVICRDHICVSAGNFLVRSCPASRAFIKLAWEQTQYINHHWWEQAAFIHLMDNNFLPACRIKVLPCRAFNSYDPCKGPDFADCFWQPGDFLVHATQAADRLAILKRYVGAQNGVG